METPICPVGTVVLGKDLITKRSAEDLITQTRILLLLLSLRPTLLSDLPTQPTTVHRTSLQHLNARAATTPDCHLDLEFRSLLRVNVPVAFMVTLRSRVTARSTFQTPP